MNVWLIKLLHKEHQYIRIVKYKSDKTTCSEYVKLSDFKEKFKDYLINPDHIFYFNQFKSVLLTDKSCESINPLDFNSCFKPEDFKSAIQSKLISDTFATLKKPKIDITTLLLLFNTILNFAIIYFLLKK